MPSFFGLILVTFAFKFALYAEINQGCIPSLFSVCAIYISVLFYFVFNEVISKTMILGIAMMLPAICLLSLDKKESANSEFDLTAERMRMYGVLAVVMALIAPLWWTFSTYFLVKRIRENA